MVAPEVAKPAHRIQQAIFRGVAADGARIVFASLAGGRCALLRDDEIVIAWGNDAYGVDAGVRRYLEMADAEMTGAAQRREPARRTPAHPRRGSSGSAARKRNR